MHQDKQTVQGVRSTLQAALQTHDDLSWARFRARVPGNNEQAAIFKLVVMPREAWWSWLEQEALERELISVSGGRWIDLEDERASSPGDFDVSLGGWEYLLDRDPARRLDFQHRRAREWRCIAEAHSNDGLNRDNHARNLCSSWYRKETEDRFRRFSEIVDVSTLFGDIPDEDEWGRVTNAAQEAARAALALACDVWKLDGLAHPQSLGHCFRHLVARGLLEPDRASRLVAWLQPALPLSRSALSEERVRTLLALPSADLAALCDVPGMAVERCEIAQSRRAPRSRFAADSAGGEAPDHEVDDFFALTRVNPEPGKFDFFISYSWQRKTEDAYKLEKVLTERGYRVFLDKKELPEDTSMRELVPALVHAIRSSSAVVVFEVLLGAPLSTLPEERQLEAIKKGHAIRVPAVPGGSMLVQWSWQTLELVAATHFLAVHEGTVFATAFQEADPGFMTTGGFRTIQELADICEAYLESRGQTLPPD